MRQAPHSGSGDEERPPRLTTVLQATDVGSAAAGLAGQGEGSGSGAGAENLLQMLTLQGVVHEGGAAGLLLGQGSGSGEAESEHTPSLTMQDVVREGASDEDLTGKHLRRAMQVGGEKEEVVGEWDGGGGEGNGCNF